MSNAGVRPYRSVLYIPGSNARAIDKARTVPADAIIFDLEDAVAPDQKDQAREALAAALAEGGFGGRVVILRMNGLDTPWGRSDARAAGGMKPDALLVPKVNGAGDLDAVAALAGDLPLWAMIETPSGVLNAAGIAAHPRLSGMVMGTNDLTKDLNARIEPGRGALVTALSLSVLAARAHGCVIVDGVYTALKDEAGLRAECEQGRAMGFDGKTLIHPDQIAAANEVFAPSGPELDLARRQIDAFDEARSKGQGVAVVDGRLVENLHIVAARRILARAEAISRLAS